MEEFTEDPIGQITLAVDDRDEWSLRSELGARVSRIITRETSSLQVVPEVRLAWSHEYLDDDRNLHAGFIGVPATFSIDGDSPARNGLVVGAGLTLMFGEQLSLYAHYNGDIRDDVNDHAGSVGVRFRF
jgi:outer membrane autotransporter protein